MSYDKAREELAQELFQWNTGTDPYFVIGEGRSERYDGDPYEPIADAILAAGYVKVTDYESTVRVVTEALENADATQWSVPRLLAKVAIRALMRGAS